MASDIFDILNGRLDRADQTLRRFERYADGEQPLRFASRKFREAFGGLFATLADNLCGLVIDATAERLAVSGFRFGEDPEADADAWAIWQANGLDLDAALVHRAALVTGRAYVSVWADENGAPRICAESPRQVVVATSAANRRHRVAALKRWLEIDGTAWAVLYLPDRIVKYRAEKAASALDASQYEDGQTPSVLAAPQNWKIDETIPNPLGVVPVVPFYNRPALLTEGRSDLVDVIPLQDAVNKLRSDMLVAAEYAAFRQRYVVGLELEVDEETGQVTPPFRADDRLWVAEEEAAKFGEFAESDLSNYGTAIGGIVQHVAAITGLPWHYVESNNGQYPSGDALKAAEASLVAKVRDRQAWFGEAWEEVLRLAFAVVDDPRAGQAAAETIWRDPESRTEAQRADALVKLQTIGVPNAQLQEDWGYTPQQIERFRVLRRQDAVDAVVAPAALS